ncbi:hypothetical protein IV72_GL000613 [Atopobium minutum]|nr:hypothetical protein IV72_GL000613 [Atopobium minutum]
MLTADFTYLRHGYYLRWSARAGARNDTKLDYISTAAAFCKKKNPDDVLVS